MDTAQLTIPANLLNLTDSLMQVKEKFNLSIQTSLHEISVSVAKENYIDFVLFLSDSALSFEQLIDLCGVDYSKYEGYEGKRYAVVLHLLSIKNNFRLRVKTFIAEDDLIISSVTSVWASANWYEREAFDLYGILFEGHNDLRRILTDYGFIGHPMRKDFPTTGFVEMRYDEVQKRVIYQPITIEDRLITPHIVREENYALSHSQLKSE